MLAWTSAAWAGMLNGGLRRQLATAGCSATCVAGLLLKLRTDLYPVWIYGFQAFSNVGHSEMPKSAGPATCLLSFSALHALETPVSCARVRSFSERQGRRQSDGQIPCTYPLKTSHDVCSSICARAPARPMFQLTES